MRKDFRVPQTLQMNNGYRSYANVGASPLASVRYTDLLSSDNYMDAKYTYPVLQRPKPVPIVPQFVKYDKQCLSYLATFIETVAIYPEEMNRRRQVKILYFLEDDTITVMEGRERVVRRKMHMKDSADVNYHWKDLNIGKEVKLNGIRFHIFDCDSFTKDFMASKGIQFERDDLEFHLGRSSTPVVQLATDPGMKEEETLGKADKLRRFLDFSGQVLSFDCQMENQDSFQKDSLSFKLYFFLEDDTITIKELKENQEGRHKFPLYLRRTSVPKGSTDKAHLLAKDLRIGEIINVFGTKFLLTDCDVFTRNYFNKTLKLPQPSKVDPKPMVVERYPRKQLPKYLGIGTPEDSLSSMFSLRPRTPTIGFPQNEEILFYQCQLEEDPQRRFILKFDVKHGTMTLTELPIDNSGIMQGRFFTSQRVRKPNCDPDLPVFYGPSDLIVGSVILVNCHRFRITAADKSVEEFKKKYPERFGAGGL